MGVYRLSPRAERDIDRIYEYSITQFGFAVAHDYLTRLCHALEARTTHSEMGRDYSHLRRGLRRFEYESHSIFYRKSGGDILILRVLGQAQLAARHLR